MSLNVIAFPIAQAKPLPEGPEYLLKWSTGHKPPCIMATRDRDTIRRQINRLMERGVIAVVERDGKKVGGVIAIMEGDNAMRFRAHFEGENWGGN
jgi:hypothetical protein